MVMTPLGVANPTAAELEIGSGGWRVGVGMAHAADVAAATPAAVATAIGAVAATAAEQLGFLESPYEFFPVLFVFAAWGAGGRLLTRFRRDGLAWPERIGVWMTGVLAGFAVAFCSWGAGVPPAFNMGISMVAAYIGDWVLVALAKRYLSFGGGDTPPPTTTFTAPVQEKPHGP